VKRRDAETQRNTEHCRCRATASKGSKTAVRRPPGGGRSLCVSASLCLPVYASLCVLSLLSALHAQSASSWPQFRGNPQLTGVAPDPLKAPLKVHWTYQAGESVESSAAIAGGTVYVGAQPGVLVALDLASGRRKWEYKVSEAGLAESSPAVAGDLVIVGDLGGVVHAVGAADGKARWTFKTQNPTEFRSSPVVAGDRILVGAYDSHLYCLSLSGKLLWTVTTGAQVHATPAVRDGVAFIAGCDEILRAIRISDGRELFTMSSGSYTAASPAIVGSRAFYGTFENEVLAVDLDARKFLWRYRHSERNFPFYASAAVANGRVFVGGRDKMVHALDASTGKAAWTFTTRARVDSSPAIAGGIVWVGSNDGRLYALDAASGKSVWEFDAGGPLSASPAIAGGRLVIGSQDGVVYCLGPA
jgi:eukaryotic-like serine/threonine-protein kinase